MEITITSAIIFGAINLAIIIGGHIWTASALSTKLQLLQEVLEGRVKKIESEFEQHRNNDDKHHNKEAFTQFKTRVESDVADIKSSVNEVRNLLIEALANKPRTRTTK
jgi:single-stranded DNA-specific DHH superfamily exonuclease